MSKTYDRICLLILGKVIERLCIPDKLINIIIGFFSNKENSVITNSSFTYPYKVLTKIDQGEIISLLL